MGEFGQVKTKGPSNLETALKEYRKKFKDKSGLDWEKRNDEPKSGKYTFIEKNYDSDDGEDASANIETNEGLDAPVVPCKLPLKTQRLMELIFNENHFNSVLQQIGYNANKLPLGKLGKSTLKKGFEHLKELSSLINQPSLAQSKHGLSHHAVSPCLFTLHNQLCPKILTNQSNPYQQAILDFSNKYYSTIPHDFGRCNPPPINNDDILKREVEMLDTLTDMEVANSIMKSGSAKVSKDAEAISIVDKRFNDLGMAEMTALDHGSQEYQELKEYLVSSSGATHGLLYRLEDIFRIERRGEEERFAQSKFSKLKDKNRLLLWHGSRTTNFGGILSQGLRIAPPEAPMNGYAFGKGIYMADCSSKSANYCLAGMSGGVGLLLLCEAELSNPTYEIACGDSNAQQMAEKHNCISTKGVGRTVPQKWKDAGCVNEKLKGVMMVSFILILFFGTSRGERGVVKIKSLADC